MIKKGLAYILSGLYYLTFFLCLLIFHPIQYISLKLGGYSAHKRSVDIMNWFLVKCLYLLGSSVKFNINFQIPENVPLIIVSNHQSMNDIPPFIWYLRKHHPKFVSKKELGSGIPSVSFNLKHGGSVLIDRKDAKQALRAILGLGKYIEKNNYSAVIFPEGTRSKNGIPKRFSENGLKMLIKTSPSAYVLPVTVNNSWRLHQYGKFPAGIGVRVQFDTHQPIKADSMNFEDLFSSVEEVIKQSIIK